MVSRAELRVPVGEGHELAVQVVSPDSPDGTVLVGLPGGGYSKGYWDIDVPGYSQAAFHASRGWTVVAIDHLGVGGSSVPDLATLTLEQMADANATVVDALGLEGRLIGAGQSMGGALLTIQQARHRTFDAVAVLGSSAIHTVVPMPPGEPSLAYAFHLDDVPRELVAADLDGFPLRPQGLPMWGSATAPLAAIGLLEPGAVAAEAAAIDVPVFVAAGEIDVVPDLAAEVGAYASAPSVETLLLRGSAHMHCFASTRAVLWEALHAWGSAL